ncbi:hypothetical protein [Flavivirga spongiicola]|uniref:Malectin domain-containing protein n=1 Tax=Flavivirga spongiicola TaxID=421621 RepID=A0ABU7Y0S6_9FLAO|nr:hypothetical protein [Flavivirga sp. MEBiC05379]MDO5980734.1 hypothetical protein [Flavivirga sp. MEBiC05379]
MKKPTLTFILFCFISIAYTQVGIGTITSGSSLVSDIDSVNSNNVVLPTVIISNNSLEINASSDSQWLNVPDLTTTFTVSENKIVKIDWTLFAGQANSSSSSGFAQMFTILEVNGVNDVASSNYFPMIHNPGGSNYRLLMNASKFSHAINLDAGTYTVRVKVLAASFLGSTNSVEIGSYIDNWVGAGNMTAQEKLNAASNKLLITF